MPQEVTLGDGHTLQGLAEGTETILPDGTTRKCKLEKVLYVPKLSCNLMSISKMSEAGKTTKLSMSSCEIQIKDMKVIAFATRVGNLCHLEHCQEM